MFGSIITIGAMIGAITSGKIADFIGRKGVCIYKRKQILKRQKKKRFLLMRFLYVFFFGVGNENVSCILYYRMASCLFFLGMNIYAI